MAISAIYRPVEQVPALLPWTVLVVSALSLALAFIAQYGFQLEPCILCLYQRVPFFAGIAFGLAAIIKPQYLLPLMFAAGLAFLGNAGIAFYHVGVEQQWWVSAAGCAGGVPDPSAFSADNLLASIQQKQPKACDDVDWTFLGISMASYNVVFCLGLGVLVLKGWHVLKEKSNAVL